MNEGTGIPMAKRSRKMRSAWASITEVRAGEVYRLRYWSAGPDGYRRRSKTVRGTRLDAERVRSELMLEHSDDAPCPTVGQAWERWALPAWERRVEGGDMAPQTLRQYQSAWSRHASPRWADVPCDAVRPLHVQQWLDGLALNEARGALKVLRPLMDYCVRYGVVDANPFRENYLMPSKGTVSERDKGVWTLAELGGVWRAVHCQWFEAAFLLAAFGGLRVGEALGVRPEDVAPLDVGGTTLAMVTVARQVTNRGGEVTERLKTPQSARTVPVPGRAGARLLDLADAADGYLSGDGLGGPSNRFRLGRSWDAACGDARRPFQNLRNSYETNMRWELRLPPWIVEPMLGHVGQGVTGQYYDRPQARMLADAVADAYLAHPFDAIWDDLGR